MNTTAQDGAQHDPQVYRRSPAGTGQSTVNGPQAGNIQQLNQKNTPSFHGHIVHAVGMRHCGRRTVINAKNLFYQLAISKKSHNKQNQTYKK